MHISTVRVQPIDSKQKREVTTSVFFNRCENSNGWQYLLLLAVIVFFRIFKTKKYYNKFQFDF